MGIKPDCSINDLNTVNSNNGYEDWFDDLPSLIVTTAGRVFFCSDRLMSILGYRSQTEMDRLHLFELIGDNDIQRVVDAMLRVLRPNGIAETALSLHLKRRDGILLTSKARIRKMQGEGNETGLQFAFRVFYEANS